jgi:predicted Zn-dependent protease
VPLKLFIFLVFWLPIGAYAQCKVKNIANVDKYYENTLRVICNSLASDEKVSNKKFLVGITDKFKNPNAFAIKDGGTQIILINPAMLELHSKNIRSISFVMAHEISHFVLGHVKDLKDSDLKDRLLVSSLSTLSSVFGFTMGGFVDLISTTTAAQYSQKQELDADKLALSLLLRNGYPKDDALYSMGLLRDISSSSSFGDFLRTHPNPSLRYQKIQSAN